MFNQESILTFLDNAFQNIEMPCLGNVNIDYVSFRLSAYRSPDKWLLLFNSVVWWPSYVGLVAMVETVGTGAVGRQGFDNDRAFISGCIEMDDDDDILSVAVREEEIDPASLVIQPNYDTQCEYGFWASVALAERFKARLLASQAEVQPLISPGLQHLLTIDEWDHPTWDMPPSQTEAFPRLADILVTSDPSLWSPVSAPNTHWSHWLPK
jgi:hypothetical protein